MNNKAEQIKETFNQYVIPSYGRFDLVLSHGQGCYIWDTDGRRYLDLGAGIAVSALGHAHPLIVETLRRQAQRMIHTSNLYYHQGQGLLAKEITGRIAPGKCFFSNSGAEANEGLYKLARRFGHDSGRYEIITALNSFHGRTLAGIAATGQEKVKTGFDPLVEGFNNYVPFNDLAAVEAAIGPRTAAILIEGVQGEGGIEPASPEYLLGLRKLCNEHNLLLMMDEVQCGYYRTGSYCSFQEILKDVAGAEEFLPDAISMAKGIGAGFPLGGFWVRAPYADILGPGSHATTYGGGPLACAVALKVLEVIQKESLAENVKAMSRLFKEGLRELSERYPDLLGGVRGLGLMLGISLNTESGVFSGASPASIQFTNALRQVGLLSVPAGGSIVRFLPPLNITRQQVEEGLSLTEKAIASYGSS
ncbi:MAG: aspartate aminotransferase family protein [Limisphaerales bacterium]|jgi:acetylornithine/N-succinyldiaminopimelate aminotransferase